MLINMLPNMFCLMFDLVSGCVYIENTLFSVPYRGPETYTGFTDSRTRELTVFRFLPRIPRLALLVATSGLLPSRNFVDLAGAVLPVLILRADDTKHVMLMTSVFYAQNNHRITCSLHKQVILWFSDCFYLKANL